MAPEGHRRWLLVWDHNGNGVIDDTEMMSEYDVDGNFAFANGYEKLRHYFDKDEDGVIKGAELSEPMFWVDSNADAQTDTGEPVPLSDYGITQIEIPVEGEPCPKPQWAWPTGTSSPKRPSSRTPRPDLTGGAGSGTQSR